MHVGGCGKDNHFCGQCVGILNVKVKPNKNIRSKGCTLSSCSSHFSKHRTKDTEHIYSTVHSLNCSIPNINPAAADAVNS